MNQKMIVEVRRFMSRHKNLVLTSEDLVKDTVKAFDLDVELEEVNSKLRDLANHYIDEI